MNGPDYSALAGGDSSALQTVGALPVAGVDYVFPLNWEGAAGKTSWISLEVLGDIDDTGTAMDGIERFDGQVFVPDDGSTDDILAGLRASLEQELLSVLVEFLLAKYDSSSDTLQMLFSSTTDPSAAELRIENWIQARLDALRDNLIAWFRQVITGEGDGLTWSDTRIDELLRLAFADALESLEEFEAAISLEDEPDINVFLGRLLVAYYYLTETITNLGGDGQTALSEFLGLDDQSLWELCRGFDPRQSWGPRDWDDRPSGVKKPTPTLFLSYIPSYASDWTSYSGEPLDEYDVELTTVVSAQAPPARVYRQWVRATWPMHQCALSLDLVARLIEQSIKVDCADLHGLPVFMSRLSRGSLPGGFRGAGRSLPYPEPLSIDFAKCVGYAVRQQLTDILLFLLSTRADADVECMREFLPWFQTARHAELADQALGPVAYVRLPRELQTSLAKVIAPTPLGSMLGSLTPDVGRETPKQKIFDGVLPVRACFRLSSGDPMTGWIGEGENALGFVSYWMFFNTLSFLAATSLAGQAAEAAPYIRSASLTVQLWMAFLGSGERVSGYYDRMSVDFDHTSSGGTDPGPGELNPDDRWSRETGRGGG